MSDRATALRTEATAIDDELPKLAKYDREALLAFAVRQCSTLSECFEPSEVEAMSTPAIRAHLEVEFDRWAEGLHNRANTLEEWGE